MSKVMDEPGAAVGVEEAVVPAPGVEAPAPDGAPATPAATTAAILDDDLPPLQFGRTAIATGFVATGTAFLVGGMFTGFMPRIWATLGGVIGVLLAVWGIKGGKRPILTQILSLVGIFAAGVMTLMLVDPGAVGALPEVVGSAIKEAKLRRPPVEFASGWAPVVVWTMAAIGYAAAWIGIERRRPAAGLLLPMPIIAFVAIAQPPEAQVIGGIVALVSFVVGLAVIFRADAGEEGRMPLSFELRRAARAAPMVIALVVGLIFLGQANLLFPKPLYDPATKAVLPKAVPLSKTIDRELFVVRSTITGPWRTGVLDVYDGEAWRLPPFSASSFVPVPRDGILNDSIEAGATARFEVQALEGTVLPTPTRAQAFFAENAPKLLTDDRTGTVRLATGQIKKGLVYSIAFGVLPQEEELAVAPPPGPEMLEMLDAPPPPERIKEMIDKTPGEGWTRLDAIRQRLLDQVIATGSGLPVPVPPKKVQDLFFGSREGTPFEIVAAQALIARWAGVPARIGYGFDGGEKKGVNLFGVHPKHGSLWLETHFEGHGWLPITGLPKHAKKSLTEDTPQVAVAIIPSDEIAVDLFIPVKIVPPGALLRLIQFYVVLAIPFALAGFIAWSLWPAITKARRRSRRRAWAIAQGRRARIAFAYAEVRDLATDLGVGDPFATPLAFLDLVVPDDEHSELAWLVTRALWGDLTHNLTDDEVFAAEELSRSLRRRLFEGQPITIRVLALISRLSLKEPYSPEMAPARERRSPLRRRKKEVSHAAA